MVVDHTQEFAQRICDQHGYTLIRSCDAGAFKKTFHVSHENGDLALKLVVGPIDPARVQREIEALQACNHTNISRLVLVGTIDHQGNWLVYFVEEFLSGGTLGSRLANGTLLSLAEGKHLALGVAEALAHLTAHNIVHRDIKPENIMYRTDGTPVLVDLGLARHLEASSLTHSWLMQGPGTPAYAAPEQLLNDKHLIDWRTDQFSLGITLSIGLLGMHPYSGSRTFDNVVERMSSRQSPADGFVHSAKARHLDLLIKMVEPWSVKRFARPEQLVEAWQSLEA